jgi:hypothetical protein
LEETVGPVSTCGRKLLRGWWRPIDRMVSFMIFTASVRNIFDTPSYSTSIRQTLDKLIVRWYRFCDFICVGKLSTPNPLNNARNEFIPPPDLICRTYTFFRVIFLWVLKHS